MKRILPMIVMGVSTACALDTFEAPGYQAGQPVAGVGNWQAEGAVIVSDDQSSEGSQALKVEAGQKAWKAAGSGEGVQFFDVYILPAFGGGEKALSLGGAELGFEKVGAVGKVTVFSGEEGAVVEQSSYVLGDGASPEAWVRVTVRVDRASGVWDLFLDGKPVFADAALSENAAIEIAGNEAAPTYIDDLDQSGENPLFADIDKDGLPDAEESAYGLNIYANDRNGDFDGDGISNALEIFAGTFPHIPGQPLPGMGVYLFVDNLVGNDANSGGSSYPVGLAQGPKASIKGAMEAAPNGATVIVMRGKGVYAEGSRGVRGKSLRVQFVESIKINSKTQ